MASTESAVPVNGTYAHQYEATNYGAVTANNANTYNAAPQQPASISSSSDIPKDEVAWYFVEQYYTTLSKTPERLYLFYNKRSQFVSGEEEEKVQVCVGQKSINERIKNLEFHDTKVRVTNVDSQGSDANIVIQVIGEISNKGQPHKRFVQTFVLAEQTNGYFVLNDIFRYLADEAEEEEGTQQEPAVPSGVEEPAPSTTAPEAEAEKEGQDEVANKSEEEVFKVDQKLEETVQEIAAPEVADAAVSGAPGPETAEVAVAENTPAAAVAATEEAPTAEPEAPAAEETAEPERPKEPAPTPAPEAQKPAAPVPAAAPKPSVPRTWASLAASAHKVVTPAVPAPAAQQVQAQLKSSAAAAPSQLLGAPAGQSSAPAREPSPANSQGEPAGWQSVTGHKKEQSRSQNPAPAAEGDNKRAYIKNVFPQVEEGALRTALSKFGDITYLDISRQKNCAFVDFKTLSGFQAAAKNNPHQVNGIELTVEERRLRPQSFNPYPRGGAPRGRGGMNNQGQRGGFNPRGGRGGSVGRGGRPAPQES